MSLRIVLGALATALVVFQSGCCCKAPWPCGKTYYQNQCGCFYWQEWFSHKPCCCEPCNTCGNYFGSLNPYVKSGPPYTRFGPIYSDGTRGGGAGDGSIGQLYPTPAGPTPAGQPSPAPAVMDDAPTEELPGPTTSVPREEERMASRPMVDSPPYSRTLGKPPRTRLFSR